MQPCEYDAGVGCQQRLPIVVQDRQQCGRWSRGGGRGGAPPPPHAPLRAIDAAPSRCYNAGAFNAVP